MANSLWFAENSMRRFAAVSRVVYISADMTVLLVPVDAVKVNNKLPRFLPKFLDLQQVTWTTNAGLTSAHSIRAQMRGFVSVVESITSRSTLCGQLDNLVAQHTRRLWFPDPPCQMRHEVVKDNSVCGFLFLGWFLPYFPFYLMASQLFMHHSLPALYFAILLHTSVFDLVT
ncbi:hypothetical protein DFH06DRAFT_715057 [Mycena polygramma]|nr:hypothetical protein DFH06DRAFT_715057 [Mycena polygramma]